MNSYMSKNYPITRNTYELVSQPYNQEYIPYDSSRNRFDKINSERLSSSPNITLYKTGNSQAFNNNTHRYLFYPSISRLSPFSDVMPNYTVIDTQNPKNNMYNNNNLNRQIIRDGNTFTNNENNRDKNNSEFNNQNDLGYTKNNNNNRSESVGNYRDKGKYQSMFDKSLELIKTISDFIPDENAKIKGNSQYYYNRDKDYDSIIEKQKTFLTKYFKNKKLDNIDNIDKIDNIDNIDNQDNNDNIDNNNFNLSRKRNQSNNPNNINSNSNYNMKNIRNNNHENENKNEIFGNSSPNNFTNEDNKSINTKNNSGNSFINRNNSNNNFNDNNHNNNNNNYNNINNDNNNDNNDNTDNNGTYPEIKLNNKIYSTTNEEDFGSNFGTGNFNKKRGISTFPNNKNILNFGRDENDKNHRNYINDYNNSESSKNNNIPQIKKNNLYQMNDNDNDNDNYNDNYNQKSKNAFNERPNSKINENIPDNSINRKRREDNEDNIDINNLDNSSNNNNYEVSKNSLNMNPIKGKSTFNPDISNQSTKDHFNTNHFLKDKNQIYRNQPLSQTSPIEIQNNYNSQSMKGNTNNTDNKFSSTNDDHNGLKNNINNIYNTNNTNNTNSNIENDINNIDNKENENQLELLDENNEPILSEDGKPFIGEIVNDNYIKDNKPYVVTKTGKNIKLSLLYGGDSEPLVYKGYPLIGKNGKFFISKNGNPIVYNDKNFVEEGKTVSVKIKKGSNNNNDFENTNKGISNTFSFNPATNLQFPNTLRIPDQNTNLNFGDTVNSTYYNLGFGGGGTSELKKSRVYKNKFKMFPKGDGDAKPPILRKRKKIKKKIK